MKIQHIFFAVCLAISVASPASAAWENLVDDRYISAKPVRATPYDKKLRSARFFEEYSNQTPEALSSSEELFRVARSFRYTDDPGSDIWQSAEETEAKKRGDCEDMAIWLYKELRKNGYHNVVLTVGNYIPNGQFHAWITFMDESGTLHLLDPVKQKRAWKVSDMPQNLYRPLFAFNGRNRYRF